MKTVILLLVGFGLGYGLGNLFPIINFLFPMREVRFKADSLIKAGTIGKTRYLRSPSMVNMPIEVPLDSSVKQGDLEETVAR